MGQGSLQSCRSIGQPHIPKARFLLDHRQLRSFSLILLEKLEAQVLQRCPWNLTSSCKVGCKLSYLLCIDTDTRNKQAFPRHYLERKHKSLLLLRP